MTRALGIDISRWNTVDWAVVGPEIDFCFAKASEGDTWRDTKFADNCQGAYDHGVPFGAYHYFKMDYYTKFPYPVSNGQEDYSRWPTPENDKQYQNFIQALRYKAVAMIALDLEETGNPAVLTGGGNWFSAAAKFLAGRLFDYAESKGIPFVIYSRNTFINDRAPQINNWIHRYNSWAALWTVNPGLEYRTWDQVKALAPQEPRKPGYFSTRPTWEFWQWTGDRYHLPGLQGALDLNVYNGTREQLREFLRYTPPVVVPQPEPEPEPVGHAFTVTANSVIVRDAPGGKDTGRRLPKGAKLTVTELAESGLWVWGKHEIGWSALYLRVGQLAKAG